MSNPSVPDYEWSHPVRVAELERAEKYRIEAQEAVCKAVALRLDLPAIASLSAEVTIRPEMAIGRFHATGTVQSRLTQICIRTGKPFESDFTADIEGFFGNQAEIVSFAQAKKKKAEAEGDQPNFVDESEDPEPLGENGTIDIGELAVQCLSLALDAYPVSPDAPPAQLAPEGEPVRVDNPFAVLGQLREFMDEEK